MKEFFEIFKKSVHDPVFYGSVSERPLKEALSFYVKAGLFFATFMTIVFSVVLIPQGIQFMNERAQVIVKESFPTNLVVKIEKGEASTNVVEPLFIPNNIEALKDSAGDKKVVNFLVIDTTGDFDEKKFTDYNTFALLAKHQLITQGDTGSITIQNLSTFPSVVVDQNTLLRWVADIKNLITFLVPVGILGMLLMLFIGFILYLIPLFLFALVPLLIARIKKIQLTYAVAYRMSLYAVVPALALKTLLNVSGFIFIPAYFTFLVFVAIIAFNMQEPKQPKLFEN